MNSVYKKMEFAIEWMDKQMDKPKKDDDHHHHENWSVAEAWM